MKLTVLPTLFLLISNGLLNAQTYYYPSGSSWATQSIEEMDWCQDRVDSLYDFLDRKNTKAFLVLHEGKMVMEKYFGTFTADSSWYWASAGKSLAAFLLATAQENGKLDVHDRTSDYLGHGWTSATQQQEDQITIWLRPKTYTYKH